MAHIVPIFNSHWARTQHIDASRMRWVEWWCVCVSGEREQRLQKQFYKMKFHAKKTVPAKRGLSVQRPVAQTDIKSITLNLFSASFRLLRSAGNKFDCWILILSAPTVASSLRRPALPLSLSVYNNSFEHWIVASRHRYMHFYLFVCVFRIAHIFL